jgi:hypothetical protein
MAVRGQARETDVDLRQTVGFGQPRVDFGCDESLRPPLVPAKAGTQGRLDLWPWIPAFAVMSGVWGDITENRAGSTGPTRRGDRSRDRDAPPEARPLVRRVIDDGRAIRRRAERRRQRISIQTPRPIRMAPPAPRLNAA